MVNWTQVWAPVILYGASWAMRSCRQAKPSQTQQQPVSIVKEKKRKTTQAVKTTPHMKLRKIKPL